MSRKYLAPIFLVVSACVDDSSGLTVRLDPPGGGAPTGPTGPTGATGPSGPTNPPPACETPPCDRPPDDTCPLWVTDGIVRDLEIKDNVLYLGGMFAQVGPETGSMVAVDYDRGATIPQFPKIEGAIHSVISDDRGGWFVAGKISRAGEVSVYNVAHIFEDGSADPRFHPIVDGPVFHLALAGGALFVAGDFENIDARRHPRLAAIDVRDDSDTYGMVNAWVSGVNGPIYDMTAYTFSVFIAGDFTRIKGQDRNGLAEIGFVGPEGIGATDWNPAIPPAVLPSIIDTDGGSIYVAGPDFSRADLPGRFYLARVPFQQTMPDRGAVYPILDGQNGGIYNLTVDLHKHKLYFAGVISDENWQGAYELGMVEIDPTSASYGQITPLETRFHRFQSGAWGVTAMRAHEDVLYLSGHFDVIDREERRRAVALDLRPGLRFGRVLPWNPSLNGVARSIIPMYGGLLVAGGFNSAGGVTRHRLAALNIDPSSADCGAPTDWNPGVRAPNQFDFPEYEDAGDVDTIKIRGDELIAGGHFQGFGNQLGVIETRRCGLGAIGIDPNSANYGRPTSWDPDVRYDIGGDLPVPEFCAGRVGAVAVDEARGIIFLGGRFDSVGGERRASLAAVDSNGVVLPWDPGLDVSQLRIPLINQFSFVNEMIIHKDSLLAGGGFNGIRGLEQWGLIGFHLNDGSPNLDFTAPVQHVSAMTVEKVGERDLLFIGGSAWVDSRPQAMITLDLTNGLENAPFFHIDTTILDPETIHVDPTVAALVKHQNYLVAGGAFLRTRTAGAPHLAAIELTPDSPNFGKLVDVGFPRAAGVTDLASSGDRLFGALLVQASDADWVFSPKLVLRR